MDLLHDDVEGARPFEDGFERYVRRAGMAFDEDEVPLNAYPEIDLTAPIPGTRNADADTGLDHS